MDVFRVYCEECRKVYVFVKLKDFFEGAELQDICQGCAHNMPNMNKIVKLPSIDKFEPKINPNTSPTENT